MVVFKLYIREGGGKIAVCWMRQNYATIDILDISILLMLYLVSDYIVYTVHTECLIQKSKWEYGVYSLYQSICSFLLSEFH